MSNINCPVCMQEIDKEAQICPYCKTNLKIYFQRLEQGQATLKLAREALEKKNFQGAKELYESALEMLPEDEEILKEKKALEELFAREKPQEKKKNNRSIVVVIVVIGLVLGLAFLSYLYWPNIETAFSLAVSKKDTLNDVKEIDPHKQKLEELFTAYKNGDVGPFMEDPEAVRQLFLELSEEETNKRGYLLQWAVSLMTEYGINSDDPDGIKYLETAIYLCPECYTIDDATFYLAEKLKETDPDRAWTLYEEVLTIERGYWYFDNALLGMGDILLTKGERKEAKEIYERIIQEYPKTDGADEAKKRLKQLK